MKKLIKICLGLNYIFWGVFFLWSLGLLIAYNGLFEFFSFKCKIEESFLTVEKERKNGYKIYYSYTDGERTFESREDVSTAIFNEKFKNIELIEICYNETFPRLSYIKNLNLAVYRNKVGLIISLIFIMFFLSIDLFSNKDYWIKKYQEFYTKV